MYICCMIHTITTAAAKEIRLRENGKLKAQQFNLLWKINSCSLFYREIPELFVSYSFHDDGSLFELYISDAAGNKQDRSNHIKFFKGKTFLAPKRK